MSSVSSSDPSKSMGGTKTRKEGISACAAIAAGLVDGGLEVITNYPGSYSHEIFELAGGRVTSINERTAYAVAWGASISGKRAAVTMKNVGLNDAADPFLNSMSLDVNAGLVVVVFDDIDVEGSQLVQDSRHYFEFRGGLWFEPISAAHAYEIAVNAFDVSERIRLPVVIRFTNALQGMNAIVKREAKRYSARCFVRDSRRFVAHPVNVEYLESRLRDKQRTIEEIVDRYYSAHSPNLSGIQRIFVGAARSEQDRADSLRLFTLPLPRTLLREVLDKSSGIVVCEHGDSVVAQMIRLLACQDDDVTSVTASVKPVGEYHERDWFEKLFAAIRSFDSRIVCGDIGTYTMDPARTIDACLCLGASTASAIGAAIDNHTDKVFCVTGDGAFRHSGRQALCEAVARRVKMTVVVIDNGGCKTTGGQRPPGPLLPEEPEIITREFEYASTSTEGFIRILNELNDHNGVSFLRVKTDL